jgi:D-xylose transport system substrate-binding protein
MFSRRAAAIVSAAAMIVSACSPAAAPAPTTAPPAPTTPPAAAKPTTAASPAAAAAASPSAAAAPAAAASPAASPKPAVAASPVAAAPATKAPGCTVGVSWNNYQEERWAKWDEPAIKAALTAGGANYVSNDAKSSAETQASNVENLISQGAKVVIILAQDGTAIKPVVASAISQGIPVIAYDRLIEDPKALYITFDNVEVGRMEARAVFAAQPKGNYVIIKGNKADANADFLRGGIDEIIKNAVASKDITIVGETYTDNWDPSKAQTEMEQFLTQANNKVDAVISENDGMAGGVVAALAAQGLAGKVPVSGQDGDAAALNRVALGSQTVDVWKDARQLGKSAGESALQLCTGTTIDKIAGAKPFTSPGNNSLSSILLTPIPITKDNLGVVLDAGWITKANLCQGVPAGKVSNCS